MKTYLKRFSFALCVIFLAGCSKQPARDDFRVSEEAIVQETLIIEGLQEEYTLLFLTDMHIIVSSETDSEQVAANALERAPMFVNPEGVSSAEQFPAWLKYAEKQEVDAMLLGGDIIDYPSQANLEYLQEHLEPLEVPYIYTPGNHDWTYPWEYMTQRANEEYRPLLEPFMDNNTAIHSLDMGEFVVVAIDNSSNQVDTSVLEEYQRILSGDKPVIVIAHVPFMTQSTLTKARENWNSPVVIGGGNYGGIYPNDVSAAFVQETTKADSPVVAVLAGHVHFYDKDFIEGEKNILQIVGDAGYNGKGILLRISGSKE